ncbi:MAG: hypothetical protein JOY82_01635 [Streptosporangiaceae bacterium]|nr:hypothetical protein [Streptosporangiaceae bacterium]MBV9853214.1 hypothetical protein [Streptosporangiaceae bacterium]
MSTPPTMLDDTYDPGPRVDARALWAGGLATALVAALIALVGILICRWLFKIPILAPSHEGAWGDANTGYYVLVAAAIALVATGLMHLLLLATPAPTTFFAWIIGLATLAAVVFPFSTNAPLSQKAATAVVDLIIGVAIGSLISSVAARAVRRPRRRAYPPPGDRAYPPPAGRTYPPPADRTYPPPADRTQPLPPNRDYPPRQYPPSRTPGDDGY